MSRGRGKNNTSGNKPAFARKRQIKPNNQKAIGANTPPGQRIAQEILAGPQQWDAYQTAKLRVDDNYRFDIDFADLGGNALEGYIFRNCDIINTSKVPLDLTTCELDNCQIDADALDKSRFNDVLIKQTEIITTTDEKEISDINWKDSQLEHVNLHKVIFTRPKISNLEIMESNLNDTYFYHAELKNVTFSGTMLSKMTLTNSNAKNTSLVNCTWQDQITVNNTKIDSLLVADDEDSLRRQDSINFYSSECNNIRYRNATVFSYMAKSPGLIFNNSPVNGLDIKDSQIGTISLGYESKAQNISLTDSTIGELSAFSDIDGLIVSNLETETIYRNNSYSSVQNFSFGMINVNNFKLDNAKLSSGIRMEQTTLTNSQMNALSQSDSLMGKSEIIGGTWENVELTTSGQFEMLFKNSWQAKENVDFSQVLIHDKTQLTFTHDCLNEHIHMGKVKKPRPIESSLRIFAEGTPNRDRVSRFAWQNPDWFDHAEIVSPWTMGYQSQRQIRDLIRDCKPSMLDKVLGRDPRKS